MASQGRCTPVGMTIASRQTQLAVVSPSFGLNHASGGGDGTGIWTSPAGQTYITPPRSALLFPSLCVPTGARDAIRDLTRSADRAAMMPRRRRTRAQNRARSIATERQRNHQARQRVSSGPAPPIEDDEPPPF